jgi:hypothetical protein
MSILANTIRNCGLVSILLLSGPILSTADAQSSDKISIAVLADLSGVRAERGQRIQDLYMRYFRRLNAEGGVSIGTSRYLINPIFLDTQSSPSPAVAVENMERAIYREDAAVVICSQLSCVQRAEALKRPLILTASGVALNGTHSNTFLINSPSPDDYEKQTDLAIKTLGEALARSVRPTSEFIAVALRSLNFTVGTDAVRFDEAGNNVGRVTFPIRPTSRPDAAACTSACATTCPSACGETACEKTGNNLCCNVCGMPRPN